MKHFKEQAFFIGEKLILFQKLKVHGINFYESFTYFITPEFSNLLWECNLSWSNASTNLKEDWLIFRQLHNMSTATIRKAKVDYFLLETSNNWNNKKKIGKNIKSHWKSFRFSIMYY